MTEGLAIEVACAKMRELGVNKEYLLRYRHFQLSELQSIEIRHWSDLMILLTPEPFTRVFSWSGIYDLTDPGINEMQYVFTGKIVIENLNEAPLNVKFLQVIPLLKSK